MNIIISLLFVAATSTAPSYFSVDKIFKKNSTQILASLEIIPEQGWKWNEKYPSKFWILRDWSPETKLLVQKEIVYSERGTQVIFKLSGKVKPVNKIIIDGTFSLCSKVICKVWRFKTFEVGGQNEA